MQGDDSNDQTVTTNNSPVLAAHLQTGMQLLSTGLEICSKDRAIVYGDRLIIAVISLHVMNVQHGQLMFKQ